jgi:probable rRNA maturation factor
MLQTTASIKFHSDQIPFLLRNKTQVRSWLMRIAAKHKRHVGTLTYVFVSDEQLLGMNQQFLQHNTYTDIITFDYSEKMTVSGELYISIDRVRENARSFGVLVPDELHRVMAHGLLHLCGFNDKQPKQAAEMRRQEEKALALR